MRQKFTLKRCSTVALALIASLSSYGHLAAAPPGSDSDTTLCGHDTDGEEGRTMSRAGALLAELGRNALAHVDAAAANLSNEENYQALMDLRDTQYLLEQIQPHAIQDLIPVFVRIGPTRVAPHDDKSTMDFQRMMDLALQGHHELVLECLRASGTPLGFIQVSLPLASALQRVQQAIESLDQARPEDAQLAMENIIDSLQTTSITVGEEQPA